MHPGLSALPGARRVLVLGGGDGLAVREILQVSGRRARHAGRSRSGDDEAVLDASAARALERARVRLAEGAGHQRRRVRLARRERRVVRLRRRRLSRPEQLRSASCTRRRSIACWRAHLRRGGSFVVQSTSPLFARQIVLVHRRDAQAARAERRYPYHVYVPSFGEWGFVLASMAHYTPPTDAAGRAAIPDGGGGAASASTFRATWRRSRRARTI